MKEPVGETSEAEEGESHQSSEQGVAIIISKHILN